MVVDVILATPGECGASAVLTPDIASPVTAEGGVENDVIVLEMLIDVAVVPSNEAGCCSSPGRWTGVGFEGVARYSSTRPEPDVDVSTRPFHGVDTATSVVEVGAVVIGANGLDVAA